MDNETYLNDNCDKIHKNKHDENYMNLANYVTKCKCTYGTIMYINNEHMINISIPKDICKFSSWFSAAEIFVITKLF